MLSILPHLQAGKAGPMRPAGGCTLHTHKAKAVNHESGGRFHSVSSKKSNFRIFYNELYRYCIGIGY